MKDHFPQMKKQEVYPAQRRKEQTLTLENGAFTIHV